MTDLEYLLLKLMEECAELSVEASKASLFGLHDVNPNTGIYNWDSVEREAKDVASILYILRDNFGLNILPTEAEHEAKQEKLAVYYEYHLKSKKIRDNIEKALDSQS